MDERAFASLTAFLARVPAIRSPIEAGANERSWWAQFHIDIDHPLAWNVVQEFASVLNYLSITERLPTVFKPISPPPYLNGGPRDFLSWHIECVDPDFRPGTLAKWLEERLPRPVEDPEQWPGLE